MRQLLFLLALGMSPADADDPHHASASKPDDAQIVVTINAEARVSAVVGAPLLAPPGCGSATQLDVKVINQGFVTAPLRATIVGNENGAAALEMESAKLSGEPEERRILSLTPLGPDVADVTIAFSIDRTVGDLAGRDRVHVLVRCIEERRADPA